MIAICIVFWILFAAWMYQRFELCDEESSEFVKWPFILGLIYLFCSTSTFAAFLVAFGLFIMACAELYWWID